jgi:hypothetical protein
MLSAVGESAQVALQAGTVTGKEKKPEKAADSSVAKARRDRVTISPEAVQMTHAALNSTEKAHNSRPDGSEQDPQEQPAAKE